MSEEPVVKRDEESRGNETPLPEKTNQKRNLSLIGTILSVLLVIGLVIWIRFSTNQKAAEVQEKAQQAAAAKQEEAEKNDQAEAKKQEAIKKALNIFLASKYKDWKLHGKSLKVDSVDNNVLYDLDLTAGDKEKIVPVIVEKFQKEESEDEYWIAYQPPQSELLEIQIDSIKNKISENEKDDDKDSSKDDNSDDNN